MSLFVVHRSGDRYDVRTFTGAPVGPRLWGGDSPAWVTNARFTGLDESKAGYLAAKLNTFARSICNDSFIHRARHCGVCV